MNKIRRFLSKCTLIVVRKSMNCSRPCSRCLKLIKSYGIKRVYYSDDQKLVFRKTEEITECIISKRYRIPWKEWHQFDNPSSNI